MAFAAASDHRGASPARSLPPESETATLLRLAFDALSSAQRSAIRLAIVERHTLPQIAAALGLTVIDVQAAMREGLYTLRDVLATIEPALLTPVEPDAAER